MIYFAFFIDALLISLVVTTLVVTVIVGGVLLLNKTGWGKQVINNFLDRLTQGR